MKTATTINLANTPFTIDSDAFQELSGYLESIHHHFKNSSESSEIIGDIETRIAEHFLETRQLIITIESVRKIITQLGTAEQFDSEEISEEVKSVQKTEKRLYRSTDDSVIAGVASGLGYYFGIDPVIIRIAFAVSIFVGGFGIIFYIILWIVTPRAVTPSDQLEMRGNPVTLSNIASIVTEKATDKELGKNVSGFVRECFERIGSFLENKMLPIMRTLFGLALVLGTLFFAILGSVLFGVIVLGIPLAILGELGIVMVYEGLFLTVLVSGYLSALIPLIILFFIGLGILKSRKMISSTLVWILFAVWCVTTIITGVSGARLGMLLINDQVQIEQVSVQVISE